VRPAFSLLLRVSSPPPSDPTHTPTVHPAELDKRLWGASPLSPLSRARGLLNHDLTLCPFSPTRTGGYGAGYRGYGGYRKTYGSGYYGGFTGGSQSGYYGGRGGVALGGGGLYRRDLELDSALQADLTKRAVETVDAVTEPVMDPAAVSASEPVGAAAEPAEAYRVSPLSLFPLPLSS